MSERGKRVLHKVGRGSDAFLARWQATLVGVSGQATGTEHEITTPRLMIGSGPEADVRIDDPELADLHLALEVETKAIVARAVAGALFRVNDQPTAEAELAHGDRISAGGQTFELQLDELDPPTRMLSFTDD